MLLYCSNVCADNDFHILECNKTVGSGDFLHAHSGSFILRSLVLGIDNFTTIDEMIKFVNHIQSTESKDNERCDTPDNKHRTFLKLSTFITKEWIEDFREEATLIYHAIISSKTFAAKFDTQEKIHFLISLVFHHASIIRNNAFGGLCEPPDQFSEHVSEPIDDYERNIFGRC